MLRWRWHHRHHAWSLRHGRNGELIGIFHTKRAGERWLTEAKGDYADAVLEEWAVAS